MSPRLALVLIALVLAVAAPAQAQAPRVGIVRKPATIPQVTYGRVLEQELGFPLVKVEGVTHRGRVPSDERIFGHGPCVELDGATVTRLLFENPGQSLDYLMHLVRPRGTPMLADARGSQVVLVEGRRLLEPATLGHILQVAWGGTVLTPPGMGLHALRLVSPPQVEGEPSAVEFASLTLLARADTPAYALMIEKLRVARNVHEAKEPPADFAVEFYGVNHFSFTSLAGLPSYSELLATKQGAAEVLARDVEQVRLLIDHAYAFLSHDAMLPDDGPARDVLLGLLRTLRRRGEGAGEARPTDGEPEPRGS